MGSQRNTGAFIAGCVIGGVVGAAIALWKTPRSGAELRASFSGGLPAGTLPAEPGGTRRFSNPVLGFVEKATAPIVGVELGKLAKDDPEATRTAPVRTSAADARPPDAVPAGTEVTEPLGTVEHATSATFVTGQPAAEATHDAVADSTARSPASGDVTSPTNADVEQRAERHTGHPAGLPGDTPISDRSGGSGAR